jgi:hypothetical protein
MMQFENYRTGRIIVKFSLLSAAAGTISHLRLAPPLPICAEPWQLFDPRLFIHLIVSRCKDTKSFSFHQTI